MTLPMFDSVNLDQIPADAPAVAGYTSGNWPTFPQIAARWPNAYRLSIAVTASRDADCLDVEPGDAAPSQAAAWIVRQQARGVHRPVIYTSVSSMQQIVRLLAAAGIPRSSVRLWAAHYTHQPHLCGPACGFGLTTTVDATQWTDRSRGRNLDESLVADDFFAIPVPTIEEARVALNAPICAIAVRPDGSGYWLLAEDFGVFAFGAPYLGHPNDGNDADGHSAGKPVGIVSSPSGNGYIIAASDGGVFAYGDASFHGAVS